MVKIEEKYRPLFMKTYACFNVAADVESQKKKRSLRVKWHRLVRLVDKVHTLSEGVTMLRYTYV